MDIKGSVVTIDAIGTQAAVMKQICQQEGHFVLTVKKNQPEAYEEIHALMDKLEEVERKKGKAELVDSVVREKKS